MAKVILICGKICSGKTYYARQLCQAQSAVILSKDEATFDLIENQQGAFFDIFSHRVDLYLRKKACEICKAGTDVILDWGFWTKQSRKDISAYLHARDVEFQWHYLAVSDDVWRQNIWERNQRILAGCNTSDFYVDDGLLEKLILQFEVPDQSEMDFWQVMDSSQKPRCQDLTQNVFLSDREEKI